MNLEIIRDDSDLVKETIISQHYLHRWPDPRSLPFSYRLLVDGQAVDGDGMPWGIVVFKKPQHHQQRGLFGYKGLPTSWQVLDLARVWINPQLQKKQNGHSLCIFSQMVSLCLRRVQVDWLAHHPPVYPDEPYHVEVIISYCDRDHHEGTAYKACSFVWGGYSSDQTKEVYYRRLRTPRKSWQPLVEYQPPLFAGLGLPLIHPGAKNR